MRYNKINLKQNDKKIEYSTGDSLLDRLLLNRGLTEKEKIEKFLNPEKDGLISPYAFSDMEKAKKRIFEAIEKGENILVWGDFDCDGVTSSAVLYKALKKLNANVSVFIPDRLLHGHGLNSKELIKFISKEKIKLVITVDCATTNTTEVALLKSFKVDTIITDHHSADDTVADAYAIINPQLKGALKDDLTVDEIASLSYNSGSVIAFKLARALLEDIDDENLINELLVISSCGAIADVVPILGENRTAVKRALEILNTKHQPEAIYRLLARDTEKKITSTDVAFMLAPRINAVGRLSSANLSFEFLTTDDKNKLNMIISKLDDFNSIRQSKCKETFDEISELLKKDDKERQNPAIILINPDWHIGIIGIVASKVVEEFNRPCFLMTVDDANHARCSIRSNDSISVYNVLKENAALFSGFGGHKLAGGCSFDLNETGFDKVKAAILKTVKETKEDNIDDNTLYADVEANVDDLDINLIETINRLEPFGEGNPQPLFMMRDVILEDFKTIGKEKNHLRIIFKKDNKELNCVKWSETGLEIPQGAVCDIAFYPTLNVFNGKTELQLEIIDIYSEAVSEKKPAFKVFDHRKKTGILAVVADYFKKDDLDIAIWAKTRDVKQSLLKYDSLVKNIISETSKHKGVMFFDYPATAEEFGEIISSVKPEKIHLMNCPIDENIENYIKQLLGMVKYCSNKLEGRADVKKLAQNICVSESFVQLALEILEDINSIKILDADKIEYLQPVRYDEFKANSMFEVLKDEFENVLNFKRGLMNCEIGEIEELIGSNI